MPSATSAGEGGHRRSGADHPLLRAGPYTIVKDYVRDVSAFSFLGGAAGHARCTFRSPILLVQSRGQCGLPSVVPHALNEGGLDRSYVGTVDYRQRMERDLEALLAFPAIQAREPMSLLRAGPSPQRRVLREGLPRRDGCRRRSATVTQGGGVRGRALMPSFHGLCTRPQRLDLEVSPTCRQGVHAASSGIALPVRQRRC